MKTLDQMTPSELRELANKKEKESKACRVGFLKHDLYYKAHLMTDDDVFEFEYGVMTLSEVKKAIEDFKNKFELVLKKGTKFLSYMRNGEEYWFDCANHGLEDMSLKWANKHLMLIQTVK